MEKKLKNSEEADWKPKIILVPLPAFNFQAGSASASGLSFLFQNLQNFQLQATSFRLLHSLDKKWKYEKLCSTYLKKHILVNLENRAFQLQIDFFIIC